MCVARHAQSTQHKKFAYLCNISRKIWMMKLFFCLQINTKVLYNLLASLCLCIARYAHSTQNSKFVILLQYLKKNAKDKVDFLSGDKHRRSLQIDFNTSGIKASYKVILDRHNQAFSKYPK